MNVHFRNLCLSTKTMSIYLPILMNGSMYLTRVTHTITPTVISYYYHMIIIIAIALRSLFSMICSVTNAYIPSRRLTIVVSSSSSTVRTIFVTVDEKLNRCINVMAKCYQLIIINRKHQVVITIKSSINAWSISTVKLNHVNSSISSNCWCILILRVIIGSLASRTLALMCTVLSSFTSS